jgi:AcrR family transcriptional regulator
VDVHDTGTPGLRERTRRAVRADIGTVGMRLFLDQGFDATTMEQIATEVGISRRSLFRYFATKEDIVLGNLGEIGLAARTALQSRPAAQPPWEALRAAFDVVVEQPGYSPEQALLISRMFHDAPSLRARQLEKQRRWLELLVPDIQARLGIPAGAVPDPRAHAIVACALACLDTATEIWMLRDGEGDLGQIYDEAVAAVRG